MIRAPALACAGIVAPALLLAALSFTGCGVSPDRQPPVDRSATDPQIRDRVEDAPPPVRRRPPTEPRLVAALGDSITEGAPFWFTDPNLRRAYGDQINEQGQYEYWARRRLGPNVSFRNCGVSGDTTQQITARFEACVRGADSLIVQGGVNDIARGLESPEIVENLRALVQRGKRLGLRVGITEVLPWNNGGAEFAPEIRRTNQAIAALAREERIPVYPWYRTLEDPNRPGYMREELTIEGDHPSVLGYKLIGETIELP